MFLKGPEIKRPHSRLYFICDKCGEEFKRLYKVHKRIMKNKLYDKDYCYKCWNPIFQNDVIYKKKMSVSLLKMRKNNPNLSKSISATSKCRKINQGDKNAMKRIEVRQKASNSRKKMLQDPKIREEISRKTRLAWKNGKFDGVKVGRCKWYTYKANNGNSYKAQGTWELAFLKWLDKNGMSFKAHRDRIQYCFNGINKSYYPDFWVEDWQCYVEIKCKHFFNREKFDAIMHSNIGLEVKILFKQDLIDMGVIL